MKPGVTPAVKPDNPKPAAQAGSGAQSFVALSHEHVEQVFDTTFVPGAGQVNLGTFELPAAGYLRHVVLLVQATGGVSSVTTAAKADAPWTAIAELTLTDVNGQPLFGPLTGYELMIVHLTGGYAFDSDPRHSPAFTDVVVGASASGNFSFLLRLPVEITQRDGLGALANMNATSTYRLRVTGGASADIYSTAPNTTVPTVRVRAYIETWTDPGMGITPPALGTTQYWSKQIININAGAQTPRLLRVGNSIRNIILICRDSTGARVNTLFPDPAQWMLDGKLLATEPLLLRQHYAAERYGYSGTQVPTGVIISDLTHELDGHPGFELKDGYLATSGATRLEIQGTFGVAGTLTVLTNDIASFATQGA